VAILFGGFGAAGSLLQRRVGLPDASVLVLQGMAFVLILASEALRTVQGKVVLAKLFARPFEELERVHASTGPLAAAALQKGAA